MGNSKMKLKNRFPITFIQLVVLGIMFCQCASATTAQGGVETRALSITEQFSGVASSSIFDIVYTQDNKKPKAVLSGNKAMLNDVTWTVDRTGVLSFSYEGVKKKNSGRIKIALNGPSLKNYTVSSSGTLTILKAVNEPNVVNIMASSTGEIYFDDALKGQNVINISASSSGAIKFNDIVDGKRVVNVSATSGGRIKMLSVNSHVLNLSSSSIGEILTSVGVADIANVSASSGGKVEMKGVNAPQQNLDASSGGEMILSNCKAKMMNILSSSAASITVSGSTNKVACLASSSGEINAKGLKASKELQKEISSGGIVVR